VNDTDAPTLTWWEARRLHYNIGLLVAGALAFTCYNTLLPGRMEAMSVSPPFSLRIFV
jgi:hypothetical protein